MRSQRAAHKAGPMQAPAVKQLMRGKTLADAAGAMIGRAIEKKLPC